MKQDNLITFIDQQVERYKSEADQRVRNSIIRGLEDYERTVLKPARFVSQRHHLRRSIIAVYPEYEIILERAAEIRKAKKPI